MFTAYKKHFYLTFFCTSDTHPMTYKTVIDFKTSDAREQSSIVASTNLINNI